MKHTLEFDSIQLAFQERVILSDVYMKCETGAITGLLGRNGQGKSCLLQTVYGTLPCEKSARFDNTSCGEAFKRPDLLLYLPQFNFIPAFLSLKKIFNHFDLDYPAFTNRFPEFEGREHLHIGKLSGGERRLVEVYTIVKARSQFAMLDEPFTHLNPLQVEKVKQFLLAEKENKGLIITDHMYRHIIDISDNIYVLVNGKTHLTNGVEDIEKLGYARL